MASLACAQSKMLEKAYSALFLVRQNHMHYSEFRMPLLFTLVSGIVFYLDLTTLEISML